MSVDERIEATPDHAELIELRATRRELGEALVRVTEERDQLADENVALNVDLAAALHEVDDLQARLDDAEATASMRKHERDEARDEVVRLKDLVGDEDQPNWDGCSRAEAIRQATEVHRDLLKWMDEHNARRAERDDARDEVVRRGRSLEQALELVAALRAAADRDAVELVRLRTIIGEMGAAEAGEGEL